MKQLAAAGILLGAAGALAASHMELALTTRYFLIAGALVAVSFATYLTMVGVHR